MAKSRDDYVEANRVAWEVSAPHHRAGEGFARLREGFARPGFSCLDAVATERLNALAVAGKDVAQLCCNNGRELLSIKNLGAATCVGFDQSAAFLEQARELAELGGLDCRFEATDIYRIPADYDAAFDLVVVTIGVLGWMPDLNGFLSVVDRLLRPGGALFVYEQHPIMNMIEVADEADPFRLVNSYFKSEPFEEQGVIVYDGTSGLEGATQYWFVHTLGDILTTCLDKGLAIESYREFPHNISSEEYDIYNDRPAQMPQSYTLVARKSA